MPLSIRESLIARKFSDREEFVQTQQNISAGTTTTVTYTPPSGYIFFPIYAVFGSQAIGDLTADARSDDTRIFNIISTGAIEHVLPLFPSMYVKRSLTIAITNSGGVSRTADFIFSGILVKEGDFDAFLKELKDNNQEKLTEIIELLKEIRNLLKIQRLNP